MGFFSWKTSDTKKSIPNTFSGKKTFEVHLITRDRKIFSEKAYEGYGDFGGVDIYTLVGEMNGITEEKNGMSIRDRVFKELFKRGVAKGDKMYVYQDDFASYESPIAEEGGLCANELVEKKGFKYFGGNMDFSYLAKSGLNMPKIVQHLPHEHHLMENKEWELYFDLLPYPKNCKYQGYFY